MNDEERKEEVLNEFDTKRDVETLNKALLLLGGIASDDEAAHAFEDDLRRLVLLAISEGASDPAGLAGTMLRSSTIEFSRWCA